MLIHFCLKIREKLRRTLSFIQYRAVGKTSQETAWIAFSRGSNIRIFKRQIWFLGECQFCQSGLTGLTWPGNGNDGEAFCHAEKGFLCCSRYHGCILYRMEHIVNTIYKMYVLRKTVQIFILNSTRWSGGGSASTGDGFLPCPWPCTLSLDPCPFSYQPRATSYPHQRAIHYQLFTIHHSSGEFPLKKA